VRDLFLRVQEAEEILESRLTEADYDKMREIYQDINKQVKWSAVFDQALPILLDMMDQLVEGAVPDMCKGPSQDPWENVSNFDLELFSDEEEKAMPRRHLILLWLTKKLLGGLKTRVNREVAEVPVLSISEEGDLLDLIDSADELDREMREETLESEEDEMDSAETEVVANVDIAPEGTCLGGSRHARTTVVWKKKNGEMYAETRCKDCKKVIRKIHAKMAKAAPEECKHPGAEWIEGKEGKEAACTDCKAVIPNPETYRWIEAGLEPFADDPTKDEVITLCSDY